jgi:hypothetical protein
VVEDDFSGSQLGEQRKVWHTKGVASDGIYRLVHRAAELG